MMAVLLPEIFMVPAGAKGNPDFIYPTALFKKFVWNKNH